MPTKLPTFVDSSVLINAIIGQDAARKMRALALLGDPNREFVATRFLTLEVMPIPTKYNICESGVEVTGKQANE